MPEIICAAKINIGEKWLHRAGVLCHDTLIFAAEGSLRIVTDVGAFSVCSDSALILKAGSRIRKASSEEKGAKWFLICFEADGEIYTHGKVINHIGELGRLLAERCCIADTDGVFLRALLALIGEPCDGIVNENGKDHNNTDSGAALELTLNSPSHRECIDEKQTGRYGSEISDRIKQIRFLLEYSDYNITSISRLMGFGTPNAFTRFFIYHTGEAPSDYRRKLSNIKPIHTGSHR